ncbi:MAG: type II toxin-antitoxin system RelB/DinJ family antitoxin [Alcaligenaceae bacterium]|nr:type II toxin-antitoxin system RelB/DinJ family antitoxin [Alcaligenaceae bacterium]
MSTTKFTIDIDKQLKEDAFTIIKSHGVTPEQAIQLFFQQIVETKVIPLKV